MKNSLSLRAIRKIAGSLISSEFTMQELHQIAMALRDDRFVYELQNGLMSFLESARFHSKPNSNYYDTDSLESLIDEIVSLVKRKRISKQSLIRAMQVIAPQLEPAEIPTSLTVQNLVEHLGSLNPDYLSTLVEKLEDGDEDQFLKGIMNRGNS